MSLKARRIDSQYSNQYVHRLVYCSFHNRELKDLVNSKLCVDHIDGDKHNNRLDNLQTLTTQQNSQKSYDNDENGRWTKRNSAVMIVETGESFPNIKAACEKHSDITDAQIIGSCNYGGIAGGYHWKYVDEAKHQDKVASRPKRASLHHIRKNTNKSNMIYCREFDDKAKCTDWARLFKCGSEVIYNAIDKNDGYSKYLDMHFELVEDETGG